MQATLVDQTPLVIFLGIVFLLLGGAVGAHIFSSKKRRRSVRRAALWTAVVVSTVVAFVTMAVAIPGLEDIHRSDVPSREALLGALIAGAILLMCMRYRRAAYSLGSAARLGLEKGQPKQCAELMRDMWVLVVDAT